MLPRTPAPHLNLPSFLPAAEHAALLAWTLHNQARFEAAGVGALGEVNTAVRKSHILQDLGALRAAFECEIRANYKIWTRVLGVSAFQVSRLELQLAAHNDGGHFSRHIDTEVHASSGESVRALSAVYYFYREPRRFSGGELLLFPFAPKLDETTCTTIAPEQNTLIVFPAWATHEVATVQCASRQFADSRFSVNCWLHMQR
ncbi:MAG: 2OG-Fe(II) oxygenase [Janthinobacterium lividum]